MKFDSASWMIALMRVNGLVQSEVEYLKRQFDWREHVTKASSGMAAYREIVTATNRGDLIAIVFATVLAAVFAGPAAAAECPGAPVPYGLIGNTWSAQKYRLGCPMEPEHDVPGRKGRLQTFQNGQIAWVPDQGPSMTIWAIRTKAHFRVEWNSGLKIKCWTVRPVSC